MRLLVLLSLCVLLLLSISSTVRAEEDNDPQTQGDEDFQSDDDVMPMMDESDEDDDDDKEDKEDKDDKEGANSITSSDKDKEDKEDADDKKKDKEDDKEKDGDKNEAEASGQKKCMIKCVKQSNSQRRKLMGGGSGLHQIIVIGNLRGMSRRPLVKKPAREIDGQNQLVEGGHLVRMHPYFHRLRRGPFGFPRRRMPYFLSGPRRFGGFNRGPWNRFFDEDVITEDPEVKNDEADPVTPAADENDEDVLEDQQDEDQVLEDEDFTGKKSRRNLKRSKKMYLCTRTCEKVV